MKVHLRDDSKVSIDMSKQISQIIEDFSEEIDGRLTSPATRDLFDTTKFTRQ